MKKDNENITFGPNRELNEKARDKIIKKVFANGIFEIKLPIERDKVPNNELPPDTHQQ